MAGYRAHSGHGGAVLMAGLLYMGLLHADPPRVNLWGEMGYDFRHERFGGEEQGDDNNTHFGRLRVNAATYLWQPWIALLDGGVGLNLRVEDRDSEDRDGHFVTGDGRLRLFPVSRFPFEAFVERSNTVTNGDLTDLDIDTTRYGVQQRYTTDEGTSFLFRAERFDQTQNFRDEADRHDVTDLLDLNLFKAHKGHNLSWDSKYTRIDRKGGPAEDNVRFFTSLRHQFRPNATLSTEDLVTFANERFDQDPDDQLNRVLQINSFAFWRPATERPLLLNGTLRLFGTRTESGNFDSKAYLSSATLSGNYQWSRRWNIVADAGYTDVRTDNGDNREDNNGSSFFQRIGARYTSANISLGRFHYGWSGLTRAGNSYRDNRVSSEGDDDKKMIQELELELGHNLRRQATVSGGFLAFNVGQNADAFFDTDGRATYILLNNIAFSWNQQGENAMTFARLSASDSRTYGGGGRLGDEDNEFQIVNLQLSRQQNLSRRSSVSGNFTVQTVRQVSTGRGAGGRWRPASTANLTYRHRALFKVPRLRFRSTLRFFTDAYVPLTDQGRVDNDVDRNDRIWENRLEYTIGRLDLRLISQISKRRNADRNLLLFQLLRRFGNL